MQYNKPYFIERLISAASYLTAGLAGFVWWIIAALTKKNVRPFLMYHIMQSIFVSFAFVIFYHLASLVSVILFKIPILKHIPDLIFTFPIFLGLPLYQLFSTVIVLYLAITSAMGLYSYLPWISDIIKGNTR